MILVRRQIERNTACVSILHHCRESFPFRKANFLGQTRKKTPYTCMYMTTYIYIYIYMSSHFLFARCVYLLYWSTQHPSRLLPNPNRSRRLSFYRRKSPKESPLCASSARDCHSYLRFTISHSRRWVSLHCKISHRAPFNFSIDSNLIVRLGKLGYKRGKSNGFDLKKKKFRRIAVERYLKKRWFLHLKKIFRIWKMISAPRRDQN